MIESVTGGFDPTVGVTDPTTPAGDSAGAHRARKADLPKGTEIDRYVILKLLGKGGMGSVYAAHDPKLDRQIALKLLHASQLDEPDAAERMVREAQALARLDDPHVVQVYDAGEIDGQIYIAMQLVDGEDLASALRRHKPSVAHILAWFVDAGRGLAAAHAAGLVHRDFKPSNVLLDRRGRIAVTDFGLARERDGSRGHTGLGTILGTPAYMSPEQHGQLPATEQSDQFAFCVSLWEALFGQHPFVQGDRGAMSPFAIGFAIYDGPLIPPPKGARKVPRRVVEALMRGLSRDPAQRWPSMTALLGELVPPEKRRMLPIVIGAGALAAIGGGAAVWLALGGGDDAPSCAQDAATRIDAIWSATTAQQIHDRFEKTGKTYADASARQVRTSLDRYAGHLRDLASDACAAERATSGPQPDLLVRRRACLDARFDALRSVVALLAGEDDPQFVDHAQAMVDGLPELADCSNTDSLLATPNLPPPDKAAQVKQLDADVQTATARGEGGEYERARTELATLAQRADALGWGPTAARAHLAYARQLASLIDAKTRDEATRAAELATANHLDVEAAHAWGLAMVGAGNQRQPDAVKAFAPVARAFAKRSGDRKAQLWVEITYGRALARVHRLDEALPVCRAALATAEEVDRTNERDEARNCMVETLTDLGKYEEVEPLIAQLVEEHTKTDGPDHPLVADYLQVRTSIEVHQGKLADARRDGEHVLAIRRKAFKPPHVQIAQALNELADVAEHEGKRDEQRKLDEEALAMAMQIQPEPLTLIYSIHQALAYNLQATGDHKGALAHFADAETFLRKRGNDSLELAFLLLNYGQVKGTDDADAGIAMLAEARKILEAHHDPRAKYVPGAMTVIFSQHKRWAEARKYGEQALATTSADDDAENVAELQFVVARAIAETHGERKRARDLATAARATYVKLGPPAAKDLKAVDDWLAKH